MPDHPEFAVLPESEWKPCPRCSDPVPEFTIFPAALAAELNEIGKKSPIQTIVRLRQEGCTYEEAKSWVHHHLQFCREPCTTPCPYCGKVLRTPNAKQCRFCGADWH